MKKTITLILCFLALIPALSSCNEACAADPWVGLWRNAANEGVALYSLNVDGTFRFLICLADGSSNEEMIGKYRVSGGKITLSGRVYNGEKMDGEVSLSIEHSGDTIVINGESCRRVPDRDMAAVFADPLAPYTPGEKESGPKTSAVTPPATQGDTLSASALVGRWGNSGVRYGFSDDGYFFRSTVITHTNMRSIYHSGTTTYSGGYAYTTPGWWENTFSTSYSYLNTLFGRYRVKDGVIRFDNVISMPHTIFEREWYRRNTRGEDDEKMGEKFQKADFSPDFAMDFEFITPTRLRLRDKSSDKDYFWEFEDDPHDVPVPTHVILPVKWPAVDFSPDMPELKTKGRLREFTHKDKSKDESKSATLVIDKTDALADIRSYVSTLRGAGWWVEEPKADSTSLSLEARKGMWRLGLKNGNGPKTYEDTAVIESTLYPEGIWPQTWTDAGLMPPQKSVIVGIVDNKAGEHDKGIRELLYFDGVDDKGVENYAARLRQAGYKIPQYSDDKWKYYKYIRVNGDLYRTEINMEGRYDKITAFRYDFKHFPDGVWPDIWRDGGLSVPDGYETIVGEINMKDWDMKDKYSSFSAYIKFLGFAQDKIDAYFKKLQSAGFTRTKSDYSDRVTYYNYLRFGGSMCRVEVEQRENDELAEILYSFKYYPDGVWPDMWREGGLSAPEGYGTIAGEIDLKDWKMVDQYSSFSAYIKFLGLAQDKIDAYFSKLQSAGFTRKKSDYSDRVTYHNYLRFGGNMCRVEAEQRENDELAEISYSFKYFPDGVWPDIWRDSGLSAPEGYGAIVGEIDMRDWNKKEEYSSFSAYVKFLGLDQIKLANYFSKLQSAGFTRKEDDYGNYETYCCYLRFGSSMCRVEAVQRENDELTEIYYSFRYIKDGVVPTKGLPPDGCELFNVETDTDVNYDGRETGRVNFYCYPFDDAAFTRYVAKLESNDWEKYEYWDESSRKSLVKQILWNGKIYDLSINHEGTTDRLARFSVSFREAYTYEGKDSARKTGRDAARDVAFPDFMNPGTPWLTKILPPEMPPLKNGGLIRLADIRGDDETPDEYKRYSYKISRTTKKAQSDYVDTLVKAGWTVTENDSYYGQKLRKGLYSVDFSEIKDDRFTFACRKDTPVVWPAEWLGKEIYPPEGCVIFEEKRRSGSWSDEWEKGTDLRLTIKCDNVNAAALKRYFGRLRAGGYSETNDERYWNSDKTELQKFMRINGAMYKVWVKEKEVTIGNISEIEYELKYHADGALPSEGVPSGFLPPDGCTLFNVDIEGIKYGDIRFNCHPFTDAAMTQYAAKLERNGWAKRTDWNGEWDGQRMEKKTRWNGKDYEMSIRYERTVDGLATFNASFWEST